jgi:transglutaminase-like putative cysteine protease
MFYSVRHSTQFRYSSPVRESVMEVRMQPRSESRQAVRNFQIATVPRTNIYAYTDHFGNAVYNFNVLRQHSELRIDVQSVVEVNPAPPLPPSADPLEWHRINKFNLKTEHYDFLGASEFALETPALRSFMLRHGLEMPKTDPLSALIQLNRTIYDAFDYAVGVTGVHSPIDDPLRAGRGVCQDFAHIMIAVVRSWGIPARYVSGYLYHRHQDKDRSTSDATHAWVEAWLPTFGWIGLDPTNNIMAGERHIRAAVGRDYADVPPTRGTFTGGATTELAVAVNVAPTSAPVRHQEFLRIAPAVRSVASPQTRDSEYQQQQ